MSEVHPHNLLPQFKEDFHFTVLQAELHHQTLEITVYNYKRNSNDEYLGHLQYKLDKLRPNCEVEVKETLTVEVDLPCNVTYTCLSTI